MSGFEESLQFECWICKKWFAQDVSNHTFSDVNRFEKPPKSDQSTWSLNTHDCCLQIAYRTYENQVRICKSRNPLRLCTFSLCKPLAHLAYRVYRCVSSWLSIRLKKKSLSYFFSVRFNQMWVPTIWVYLILLSFPPCECVRVSVCGCLKCNLKHLEIFVFWLQIAIIILLTFLARSSLLSVSNRLHRLLLWLLLLLLMFIVHWGILECRVQ